MVGGFLIFEVVLKLLLPNGIRAVLIAFLLLTLGIELDEIYCKFADGLFDFFLFSCKLLTAHFAERGTVFADEFLQIVHLIRGDIKHISVAVFKNDILFLKLTDFHYRRTFAKTYAMHTMHNIIPRFWCNKLLFAQSRFFLAMFSDALGCADNTQL